MLSDSLLPVLGVLTAGLVFQLSVIVAVGPQNVVLLKQGVRRHHIGLVVSICLLGDLVLLPLGTAGVSTITAKAPLLLEILRWAGVAYLVWFAATCLRDARHPTAITGIGEDGAGDDEDGAGRHDADSDAPAAPSQPSSPTGGGVATLERATTTRRRARTVRKSPAVAAAATAFAVTFLNPAAWVDGIVVFGTMANQYDAKWTFTLGALVASALFFVTVGYGARLLSRPLSSPKVWRWINLGIGVLMLFMATRLALG